MLATFRYALAAAALLSALGLFLCGQVWPGDRPPGALLALGGGSLVLFLGVHEYMRWTGQGHA